MANTTVYPFGTGGQLPSNIGLVNDLTTGGADKALTAEQGKVLNNKTDGMVVLSFTGSSADGHPAVIGKAYAGFIPGHTYRFWVQNPGWDMTGLTSMDSYDKFNIRAYNNKDRSTSNTGELKIDCIDSTVLISGTVLPYYDWTLPAEVSGTTVKEWFVCLYGRAAAGVIVYVYAEDITYTNELCGDANNFRAIELNDVKPKSINSSGTVSDASGYFLKVVPVGAGDVITVNSSGSTSVAALSYAATADASSVTMLQMHVSGGGYYWARIKADGYAYICFSRSSQAKYKIAKETPYELLGVKQITKGKNVLEELVGTEYTDTTLWGNGYLTSEGGVASSSSYKYSKNYYKVIPGDYIQRFSFSSNAKIVIYDESKSTVVSYLSTGNATSSTKFTVPSGGAYIRISVSITSTTNTDTLTFVSQQDGNYYVDTEDSSGVLGENVVTTIDNNMINEKEYLDKSRWTITNEAGTNSIDNYGQDNVRYAYKLPNNVNKIHVRFDFQFTAALIAASSTDQPLCQLSGYNCWRASMRQRAFEYVSGSSYIGRGASFTVRVGSDVSSDNLNYVYYKTNEGTVAYTIRLKDATTDNVLLFLSSTAITIKLGDDVLETISVSTSDDLNDVIDTINASTYLRATPYFTTGKTWGDTNYGNSNGIPIASLSIVPVNLRHDEQWHTFEAILDLESLTSACAYDGITRVIDIAEPTNMTLYIGGRPNFTDGYKNTPIRVRNLHIGLNSFEDAELVQNLNLDGTTYTKQLISNANPKVIIFEGHNIEVRRDTDTIVGEMSVSTDRLRRVFTYALGKGYAPITWKQLKDWKIRGIPLPSKRCFTVMMDDFRIENYLDISKRLPFEQFGVKPGLAIISNRQRSEEVTIDGTTYTLAEAFDAIDRAEWYATSHTYNHTVMTDVANADFFTFTKQCIVSAQKLGIHDDILVYPQGSYKTATMLLLPISGFALGVFITSNQYICRGSNNYYLSRVEIGHGDEERTDVILARIV